MANKFLRLIIALNAEAVWQQLKLARLALNKEYGKKTVMTYFNKLSLHLPTATEENQIKSTRIAGPQSGFKQNIFKM